LEEQLNKKGGVEDPHQKKKQPIIWPTPIIRLQNGKKPERRNYKQEGQAGGKKATKLIILEFILERGVPICKIIENERKTKKIREK